MKNHATLLPVVLALLCAGVAHPQDLDLVPPPEAVMPKDLRMSTSLWKLERALRETAADLSREARRRGLQLFAGERVNVEIVGPEGARPLGYGDLLGFDLLIDATGRRRTSAWVFPHELVALARALPAGYRLEAVLPSDAEVDECADADACEVVPAPEVAIAEASGSAAYRAHGADGSGVRIAIIDYGFERLSEAQAAGEAPSDAHLTEVNLVPGTDIEEGGKHGTACLETAFDHAPGADYLIYRLNGANVTHLEAAIMHAVASGVDVISHSSSWYNHGWEDGSGDVCAAVQMAVDAGILFVTSAGNCANHHWQGVPTNADGDAWLEFAPGDESIDVWVPDGVGGTFYLSFDVPGAAAVDYDLFLLEDDGSTVLDSSTEGSGSFEEVYFENDTGAGLTVKVAVRLVSGPLTELEVFFTNESAGSFSPGVTAGSTTSPSNATHPAVLSCGAVKFCYWDQPTGGDVQVQSYSGRGPSNGGMVLPDLCGATGNGTIAYTKPDKPCGAFGGTSCAAPNVAGAAACFLSAYPALTNEALAYLLKELARMFKDWGDAGPDNVFGAGGSYLYTWHPGTVWIDRRVVAWTGPEMIQPFYFVEDAVAAAPAGGRLVFLGQSYPETITLAKQLLAEAIGWAATLGS